MQGIAKYTCVLPVKGNMMLLKLRLENTSSNPLLVRLGKLVGAESVSILSNRILSWGRCKY